MDNPFTPRSLKSIFDQAQAESRRHAAEHPELDFKAVTVLLTACVVLTIQYYGFRAGNLQGLLDLLPCLGADQLAHWINERILDSQDRQLTQLLFWAAGTVAAYVLIPAAVIKIILRERIADYGLKYRGILGSSWVYLVMFLFMVGPLVLVSYTAAFQAKYPFYHPLWGEPLWPRLWTWEAAYVSQFFALEFFFRGFMLHGLRPRLGIYAVFVMTVPYCMIHFGKPMAETCGAIGAGVVLGLMSLKTRSIWLGACLHVAVAMSMDFLALWQTGRLG